MLGTLRFVLALLVVANHLWLPTANKVGAHAVLGFYVISGYLMTRIVSEVYVGPGGRLRYFANRFLRIFPAYWFVAVLTLAGLAALPGHFGNIHGAIRIPQTAYEWLQNVSLFDLIYAPLRVIPPAWSLSVELVFYILIGTGISRGARGALVWWIASAAYTAYLVASGATFGDRYTPPAAASLFFSTGAVVYHCLKSWPAVPVRMVAWWLMVALFCLWPLAAGAIGWDPHMIGFYGAYLLFVPLFAWTAGAARTKSDSAVDRFLGDLAYPVFLGHFVAAGFANVLSGNRLQFQGFAHFLLSLLLCLALAALMARSLDAGVERLRDRIRPGK